MAFISVIEWNRARDKSTENTIHLNTNYIIAFRSWSTEPPYTTTITYLTGNNASEMTVAGAPVDIANMIASAANT
ncbi:hypothetical protein [Rhizobium anhuiense]|uniref:Uncharacterized protein n=1 Tax=Rhizobium anhuiense TaxID=1184720 RepID=A0A3S0QKH1_9HYPH|nr:hypothetical protein [Rhizobium anhuiense]RUL98589.1 hypothetical protein EEQ99_24260 [Rhizobium anhuiense]GGD98221.1 hypothetical protein GCM10008012_47290 [Rhizobium anhuiense]